MTVPYIKATSLGGSTICTLPIGKLLCTVLLSTFITSTINAQAIGYWEFTNTTAGTGGTYNTVSNATFSSGIPTAVFTGSSEYYGQDAWPTGSAINTGAYMQFSISPNAGYELNLSSIVLRMRRSNTGTPTGSGPTRWILRSSLDGYASNISSDTVIYTHANYTIPLNSTYHHIYSTITFRLYGYNVVINSGGYNRLVMDNITINGIGSTLPLQITGIQAAFNSNKSINIKWQASNIQEGSIARVERSTNGTDFTTIDQFTEQETKSAASYTCTDNNVPAATTAVYYRIKINEPSGWTYYSWLVKMNNQLTKQATINYASVQAQSLLTSVQVTEKGTYALQVHAQDGRLLQTKQLELPAGVSVLTLPLDQLAHGVYTVSLYGNQLINSRQFVY